MLCRLLGLITRQVWSCTLMADIAVQSLVGTSSRVQVGCLLQPIPAERTCNRLLWALRG